MERIIPLFKSHYSLGKSILTLENELQVSNESPTSCLALCKEAKLEHLTLVEDGMSGFLQAYQNTKEHGLKLIFGLRMTLCDDSSQKDEDSRKTNNKIIIFIKNVEGYKSLIKIYSFAAREGFYYHPRIDHETLHRLWDNENLLLAVPFYDSFIYRNLLENALCVPEWWSFTTPTFFKENNNLPFDNLISESIDKILEERGCSQNSEQTKSIFYNNKKDFKAYLTFRCISNRTTLDKPNLDHMTSNEFSFESWKEVTNG